MEPVPTSTHVPSAPPIARLASGFWVSQALYVVAKLGIADLLEDGPRSVEALASAAGANAGALGRVLRALASFGIFEQQEDGCWRLTPAAEPLRSGVSGSMRAFVVMLGEPESWRAWGEFLHSVKTGQPAFEHVFGAPVFRYMSEHPDAAAIFDAAMIARSAAEDEAMLAAYDLSSSNEIVDVGGGRGALLLAALNRHPRLDGVLFELPHVIDGARESIGADLPADRCRFHAGDFFRDALPAGADVYVLKKVIHDWDDARARQILAACRRAMSRNSSLLLIEPVIPPGNGPSFAKLLDLFMLVWPGGQERTEDEHRTLLASAGLALVRIVPTASPVSVIEARAA